MPVLWQVRSADYSNRIKRDEAWDLLVQLTREKIPEADLCFGKKKVDSIRASFRKELRRVRDIREVVCPRMMSASQQAVLLLQSNIVRFHLTFSSSFGSLQDYHF